MPLCVSDLPVVIPENQQHKGMDIFVSPMVSEGFEVLVARSRVARLRCTAAMGVCTIQKHEPEINGKAAVSLWDAQGKG